MTTLTTLIALPPDLVERDRVRRQAQRVGAIEHPGLAPLRDVAFAGNGLALTWELPSAGGTHGDALAALAPIAGGLALLHDAGLAHGGVAEGAIHVIDGRGVLTGWRPGGTPEGDVRDLVAVLDTWLPAASVGADIVQLIISAQDPDPRAVPSMARVAALLERAAAHVPHLASPPAHRRARLVDDPQDRADAGTVPVTTLDQRPATDPGRGRHAARRSGPLGSAMASRMSWRWGVAAAGALTVALLGVNAVGAAGSAEQVCPAPASAAIPG